MDIFIFISELFTTQIYNLSNDLCKYKWFEDTRGVIRAHKSKDRQHNGQRKNDKWTNNDIHNTMQKTK